MRNSRLCSAFAGIALALGSLCATAQAPQSGGTITALLYTEPTSLVTLASTAVATSVVHTQMFESLLEYDGPDMKPKPGIAESWTVSPDHKTYTFKLRKDVKFSDGKPLTSADVKFSIELVRKLHSRGKINFANLESIETPDAHTVVFKLKDVQPYFLKVFQPGEVPMLPKHILDTEKYADTTKLRSSDFMTNPVGTGPFKLTELKRGEYVILDRNPHYWKAGRPLADKLIFRIMFDGNARIIAMEKGDADLAIYGAIPDADIERLGKLPHIAMSSKGMEALAPVANLTFNLRDKLIGDPKVRQAINLAIDRNVIAKVVWSGNATATNSIFFPTGPFYNAALKPFEYNRKKANDILDAAGYKAKSGGTRFAVTIDYIPYGATWARMADYTKAQLRRIGIDANIRALDLATWLKVVYTDWDFQMTFNFGNNYADPAIGIARYVVSSSITKGAPFTNGTGYSNARVDELFAKAATESDPAKRKAMYDEVQTLMYNDLPSLELVAMPTVTIWNKRLHGVIQNGISPYVGYSDMWIEK